MKKVRSLNYKIMIEKYQKQLEIDPLSKVFAPLADCYRKSGNIKEAFLILRKGLKIHTDYVLGKYVLAQCYFEKKNYEIVYEILNPIVEKNLENFLLQKIYAYSCLYLNHLELSYQKFKYLLYLRPQDQELQKIVKELEEKCDNHWSEKSMWLDFKKEMNAENSSCILDLNNNFDYQKNNLSDEWNLLESPPLPNDAFFNLGKNPSAESKLVSERHDVFKNEVSDINLADIYIQKGLYSQALGILNSYKSIGAVNPVVDQKIIAIKELLRDNGTTKSMRPLDENEVGHANFENNQPNDFEETSLRKLTYLKKISTHFLSKLN